jgi:GDP-4-dehydro-6-deoxy-D-mannose reductase
MRPFNHIGPGQLPGFLVPDLAQKIRERTDDQQPVVVGNLATKRDYTDVRDVARAYIAVATAPQTPAAAVYNVCSGTSRSGEEVLAALASALDIPVPPTEVDQSLLRPNDIMDIRGDNSRLADEFGWSPQYSFEQTISDFVHQS